MARNALGAKVERSIIVDGGRADDGRPIILVYGCRFPDPQETDYDDLLRVTAEEYIMVFFAGAMKHMPKVSWMHRAYRSLERQHKKNIKRLYIVHPSVWWRIILFFMQKIVSSKFAQKIVNVGTLAEIQQVLKLPPTAILSELRAWERGETDTLQERQEALRTALPATRLFGVSVAQAAVDGGIPKNIDRLMAHLQQPECLQAEGIFRRSPDSPMFDQMRQALDRGAELDFSEFDVYSAACLLKAWFRELREPLFPMQLNPNLDEWLAQRQETDQTRFLRRSFFSQMSSQSRLVLRRLMDLLHECSEYASQNGMKSHSLAVIWAPNLFRFDSPQAELKALRLVTSIVEYLIVHPDIISE